MSLGEQSREWCRGKYIPPRPNDPNSPIVVISPDHYEQPLLAKCLGALGRFWLAHWQWIIGTFLAIIGLLLTLGQK